MPTPSTNESAGLVYARVSVHIHTPDTKNIVDINEGIYHSFRRFPRPLHSIRVKVCSLD